MLLSAKNCSLHWSLLHKPCTVLLCATIAAMLTVPAPKVVLYCSVFALLAPCFDVMAALLSRVLLQLLSILSSWLRYVQCVRSPKMPS